MAGQLEILYDHYRDACLNQKYYGHRYVHIERWNKGIEIAIAVGSATTTIGAWPLWQSGVLQQTNANLGRYTAAANPRQNAFPWGTASCAQYHQKKPPT